MSSSACCALIVSAELQNILLSMSCMYGDLSAWVRMCILKILSCANDMWHTWHLYSLRFVCVLVSLLNTWFKVSSVLVLSSDRRARNISPVPLNVLWSTSHEYLDDRLQDRLSSFTSVFSVSFILLVTAQDKTSDWSSCCLHSSLVDGKVSCQTKGKAVFCSWWLGACGGSLVVCNTKKVNTNSGSVSRKQES